jgi:predicted PurR-regulated permease PerM
MTLHVPWAPLWAVMAAALQFIPHFGPLIALIGPAMAMAVSRASFARWLWLLAAFAAISAIDGLILQPWLMHRQNKVPFLASLLAPLALGIVIPFWGVLLAPPLLAVVYAYRGAARRARPPQGQKSVAGGEGVVLPPERDAREL